MRKQRAFAGLTEREIEQIPAPASASAITSPANSIRTPQSRLDLCQFTPALKAELFPRLRAAFEQRSIRIPISRDIREDLHAIQRTVTQAGQINCRAPHTPDGHSDRTTALALASAPPSACATSISVPRRTADLRWARNLTRLSRDMRLRRRGFWL